MNQQITVLNGHYNGIPCLMEDGEHWACLVWQAWDGFGPMQDCQWFDCRYPHEDYESRGIDTRQVWKPYVEGQPEKLSHEALKEIGFINVPNFTVMDSLTYDLGRDRYLSIGCVGTPNEMLFIEHVESKKVTDLVCLHNFDYDGYLTIEKLKAIISALK